MCGNHPTTVVPQPHILAFEGNFEDYIEDKIRRLGVEAVQPQRMKYKPLERCLGSLVF